MLKETRYSEATLAEIAKLNKLRDDIIQLGVIDTEEKALAYRQLLVANYPHLIKKIKEIGLDII